MTKNSNSCLVHGLFEEQVKRTPTAPALIYQDTELSYQELNRQANLFARHLQTLGVKTETRVGILMNRSFEMIVSILAVLKASGAYVPIDVCYPEKRIRFILEHSEARILLTDKIFCPGPWQTVFPSQVLATNHHQGKDNLSLELDSKNLCYVMYTSGSTGQPKGVSVTHQGLANYIKWGQSRFVNTGPSPLYASIAFDATISGTLPPLFSGHPIKIFPNEAIDVFFRNLESEPINILKVTPSHLVIMRSQVDPSNMKIGSLVVGGESFPPLEAAYWKKNLPKTKIINHYGPTETIVGCCSYELLEEDFSTVPIGKAITNVQAYVLGENLEKQEAGVVGEIFIGGIGLARGYHNAPDLTAEKFIPNPFSEKEGERLYKTGDLARYLFDGNIEFLGRRDEQVKVRGFRIELGEIQAVLQSHPFVKNAFVMLYEKNVGNKQIIAYVIMEKGKSPESKNLLEHLEQKIPDYMIPSQILFLDNFPLTSNGKINRQALPSPFATENLSAYHYENDLQKELAKIIEKIMGIANCPPDKNLTELGLHSIAAVLLSAWIKQLFQKDILMQDIFQYPSIQKLAQCIEEKEICNEVIVPFFAERRPKNIPLSFQQKQVWFLHKLNPAGNAYNSQCLISLKGNLQVDLLEKTLEEIISRNEIYRTTFEERSKGEPEQIIHPPWKVCLPQIDLRHLKNPKERQQELDTQVKEIVVNQHFVFERLPLITWTLFRLEDNNYQLLRIEHHFVHDGWSVGVFFRELKTIYETLYQGKKVADLPQPNQFADYALWQKQVLQGAYLNKKISFWKTYLANSPSATTFRNDKPRPKTQKFQGDAIRFEIDSSTYESLEEFSRHRGVTLFATLYSAFAILLYRYTQQKDLVLATGMANRIHPALESIIGMIVNSVALRSQIEEEESFDQFLQTCQKNIWQVHENQDTSFDKVIEEIKPQRFPGMNPLCQILFSFHDSYSPILDFGGLEGKFIHVHNKSAKYDMNIIMIPWARQHVKEKKIKDKSIFVIWEYDSSIYHHNTVEQIVHHYLQLLKSIVQFPQERVSHLNILSEQEKENLIQKNFSSVDYPREKSIIELFEEQAVRNPESIALIEGKDSLSYQALNEKANLLAHYLVEQGVDQEEPVGLILDSSFELIIGILAILKAGGAYVPLDPSYPLNRIHFMLNEALVGRVLTNSSFLGKFSSLPTTLIPLDKLNLPAKTIDFFLPTRGANLAYIMYTSGSTGFPKGVGVEQRSIIRLVKNTNYIQISSEDIFIQASSPSFDASTFEIWGALLHGAKLCLVRKEQTLDLNRFTQLVKEHKITIMWLTAGFCHLLTEKNITIFSSLKYLLAGGEKLSPSHFEKIHQKFPDLILINGYGPTENTTFSTYYEIQEEFSEDIPLGKAISHSQVYILDNAMQIVPIGIPGEIYVGGDGLARGYCNQPKLSAEKFLPHPFSQKGGERLYKTGDLAYYDKDENIIFLGRADEQIKIRGFRIELGEIESVLLQDSQISQAAVIAQEDSTKGKYIIAYYVGQRSIESIRGQLKLALPPFMLPSYFVQVQEFPKTPNGKVDRLALTQISPLPSSPKNFEPPQTDTENQLAEIWKEILGLPSMGIYDNFFHLGGHSLLVIKMVHRIQQAMKKEIPLHIVFESPTIEELANYLKLGDNKLENIPRVEQKKYPLSLAQQRLWFLTKLEPKNPFYNISLAKLLVGKLNIDNLETAFNVILKRQKSLRTQFREEDGAPYQEVIPFKHKKIPYLDLTIYEEFKRKEKIEQIIREEPQKTFRIGDAPLIRTMLIKWQEEKHILFLGMHHIISDGWSLKVLWEELTLVYNSLQQRKEVDLTPLPIQYTDFSIWQLDQLKGVTLQKQEEYWRNQFSGEILTLDLPTDWPRPKIQKYSGASVSIDLEENLSLAIEELAHQENITAFMVLLTAWNILLSKYSGQDNIVVGAPIANREHNQTENLIGFFVNTLALRTDLSNSPTFLELLQQVRTTCLEAYQHQDYPFEQLVEIINPSRDTSRHPIFQVMINMVESPLDLDWEGIEVEKIPLQIETSKFDLTLYIQKKKNNFCLTLKYSTALFQPSTIERMASHLRVLLEESISSPHLPITSLNILTEKEKKQFKEEYSSVHTEFPHEKTTDQLFEEQVKRTSYDCALIWQKKTMIYQELNAKANQLAHFLVEELGISPKENSLIGICLEHSFELVICTLAVWKTGCGYLPLDPDLPKSRLSFMTEDASCILILSEEKHQETLSSFSQRTIWIDTQWSKVELFSEKNLEIAKNSKNSAYAIYTSGSTGKPKGVKISHRSLINFMISMERELEFSSDDTILAIATFSFDISLLELFLPLLVGAKVVLGSKEISMDGKLLSKCIEENGVTKVQGTPTTWRILLAKGWKGSQSLTILCGGENLPEDLAKELLSCGKEVWNLYGPTETTVWSSLGKLKNPKEISVGRTISNMHYYISSAHNQLQPMGIPGEIYIGGEGVAQEYLNLPELSQEKFIKNPFQEYSSLWKTVYKTGDIARRLPNGEIEILGRKDHQVKIRGFRVELGEIEAVILENAQIKEAVVMLREDEVLGSHLVAYFVGNEDTIALQDALQKKLPAYMIPSRFVNLLELPLTPSGKIDRKTLGLIELKAHLRVNWEEPKTEIEIKLVQIWQQVLQVEPIGVYDNFFFLGGHSFLALQIIARIEEEMELELPLIALFEAPTVKNLAQYIESKGEIKKTKTDFSLRVFHSLKENQDDIIFPTSHQQKQNWLLQSFYPKNTNQIGSVSFCIGKEIDLIFLEKALRMVIEKNDILRARYTFFAGELLQVISSKIPETLWDKKDNPIGKQEIPQWITNEKLNYNIHLPWKILLKNLENKECLILIFFNKIAFDETTICYFWKYWEELYLCLIGKDKTFPLLPQYQDYALGQQEIFREKNRLYWENRLRKIDCFLEIPSDYPRLKASQFTLGEESLTLSIDLSTSLVEHCQKNEWSLLTPILGAFQIILSEDSGREDIVVASSFSQNSQNTIGNFSNLLLLSSQVTRDTSLKGFLQDLDLSVKEAQEYAIPFLDLLKILNPPRLVDRFPLAQFFCQFLSCENSTFLGKDSSFFCEPVYPFDISLSASFTKEKKTKEKRFKLKCFYNSRLFLPSRMQGMLSRMLRLWEDMLCAFETPLASLVSLEKKRQFLIQGVEIDLARIESILNEHEKITEAIVLLRNKQEKKELIALVVLNEEEKDKAIDLRQPLKRLSIPPFPIFFISMNKFPRKEGEVDREKLQNLVSDYATKEFKQNLRTAKDPLQFTLLEIWKQVLNQDFSDIEEDFFHLGGSSIQVIKMLKEVEQIFHLEIAPSDFIEAPSIEGLSNLIVHDYYHPEIITEVTSPTSKTPFFFFHGDFNGLGFYAMKLAKTLKTPRAFYSICPHGVISSKVPSSIEQMVDEYIPSIIKLIDGPFYIGGFCNGSYVALEVARKLSLKGKDVKKIFLIEPPIVRKDRFHLYKIIMKIAKLLGKEKQGKEFYLEKIRKLFYQKSLPWTKEHFHRLKVLENQENIEDQERRLYLREKYRQVIATYFPSPLDIPLAIFFSEEMFEKQKKDDWETLFPKVNFEKIPGEHLTSITWHLDDCREALEKYLDD